MKKMENDFYETFETQRLLLRPMRLDDIFDFHEYYKDPDVGLNAGWEPQEDINFSLNELKRLFEFGEKIDFYAIQYKDNNKVIGHILSQPDPTRPGVMGVGTVGYALNKEYWGRGLMTEAMNAILDYLFLRWGMITVSHFVGNERSKRVIEKCGFKYEGTLRRRYSIISKDPAKVFDSLYNALDQCEYAMTREEFEEMVKAESEC